MMKAEYDKASVWGCELQMRFMERASAAARYHMGGLDLTTAEGIKSAAEAGVSALQSDDALTVEDARLIWQISQCLKKFEYGCTADLESQQNGWIERNNSCAQAHLPWWVRDGMRDLLAPLEEPYCQSAQDVQGRFGNGAVFEGLTPLARWNSLHTFPFNPRWPDATDAWCSTTMDTARLSAVPKDMFKRRLITVEPAEATFLQQWIRRRLLISMECAMPWQSALPQQKYGGGPETQRRRCVEGSLTGATATLDFSDASDSITVYDVCEVFPTPIVADLLRGRSNYVSVNGVKHACHMFAGMGNATTFPVESLFFWALCTTLSRRVRDFTPVSVFGDDIVLGTKAARHPLFQEWLAESGIKLNFAKSGMSTLPGFREACGVVAFRGHELALLRVKGYADNIADTIKLCELHNLAVTDQTVHPLMKGLLSDVGLELSARMKIPRVPRPLVRSGLWLVDTSGQPSCRRKWDARWQVPVVKVRVASQRSRIFWSRDLTDGEALGVLNGQLSTVFHDAPAGYKAQRCGVRVPCEGFEVTQQWVPEGGESSEASQSENFFRW